MFDLSECDYVLIQNYHKFNSDTSKWNKVILSISKIYNNVSILNVVVHSDQSEIDVRPYFMCRKFAENRHGRTLFRPTLSPLSTSLTPCLQSCREIFPEEEILLFGRLFKVHWIILWVSRWAPFMSALCDVNVSKHCSISFFICCSKIL